MWAIVAIIIFVITLLTTEFLFKKNFKFFWKLNWIVYCLLPFITFLFLTLPLMIAKVNFEIIYWVAAISMSLTFGISCSVLYNKFIVWRDKKILKGK